MAADITVPCVKLGKTIMRQTMEYVRSMGGRGVSQLSVSSSGQSSSFCHLEVVMCYVYVLYLFKIASWYTCTLCHLFWCKIFSHCNVHLLANENVYSPHFN